MSTLAPFTAQEVLRFWMKVDMSNPGGCWTWKAGQSNRNHREGGYGCFRADGKMHRAHRFSYRLIVGEVPPGLVLDHLCRNRLCVNPVHLEPVIDKVNSLRGAAAIRSDRCRRGHLFNPDRFYKRPGRKPQQFCSKCESIRIANRKKED